jgi:hypothetical protein
LDSLLSNFEALHSELPPITDPLDLAPFESISRANPALISVHAAFHGAMLTLQYRVLLSQHRAGDKEIVDGPGWLAAHAKTMESALALAELSAKMRGETGLTAIQCVLDCAVCGPSRLVV